MKITDEIFQVGGGEYTSLEDGAVYLIQADGHGALIDAGCGRAHETLLQNIRNCGLEPDAIEYLLITHCHFDHTGGAKAIKDLTRCRTVAHELDAVYLEAGDQSVTAAAWYGSTLEPFAVDIKLSGPREQISLGDRSIEALHIPGHSPGSVAYLMESQGLRVLFGQDVHGPLDAGLKSDPEDYKNSLNLLLSLDADILCEGHYGVYTGKDEVQEFIQSFL